MFKKQTKATLMGVKKRLQKHPGTQQSTLPWKQCISKKEDDFHVAVAKTLEEARKLVEVGFEYVCSMGNAKIFRKRK